MVSGIGNETFEAAFVTTPEEQETVFAIRGVVFVEEQAVPPEEEWDSYDLTATHFLVRYLPTQVSPLPTGSLYDSPIEKEELAVSPLLVGERSGVRFIVATARLVDKGGEVGKVGRVAVLRDYRGKGVGALLMHFIEETARTQGFAQLILEAQCHAIPFYEKLGYVAEGDIFLDCNIEHRFMSKALTNPTL